MKYKITNYITNHIFDSLGITLTQKTSLKEEKYSLAQTIDYMDDDENHLSANLYGIEINMQGSLLKIILADFSKEYLEHFLVVKLEGSPTYGCYLFNDNWDGAPIDSFISYSIKPNNWLIADVAIQGTFLAGMESLKDLIGTWKNLSNENELIVELKSFIGHINNFQG